MASEPTTLLKVQFLNSSLVLRAAALVFPAKQAGVKKPTTLSLISFIFLFAFDNGSYLRFGVGCRCLRFERNLHKKYERREQ